MENEDCRSFLVAFLAKIEALGIDISSYDLDHLGYQTTNSEEYDRKKADFLKIGKLIGESIVGGRRVGHFELIKPLVYGSYEILAVEVYEPKAGQICTSGWEHGEFVIDCTFDELIMKYPDLKWDTSAISQPVFAFLKLRLSENMQVKFHYKPLLEIVRKKQ